MSFVNRIREKWKYSEFRTVFNFSSNETLGRSLLLLNNFLATIANVFVTGVFYTGFLAANGIDIVRVGIISFIPYIAWAFSLFSPAILCHFKKRRALLIFNSVFYHVCVVLATTIMPLIVKDPTAKTIWFGVFIFAGNLVNALVGSGASAWHLHFIPKEQTPRNVFFSWMNLMSFVMSSLTAIVSSILADSLANSPKQAEVLMILRFIAFALFIINGLCVYLIPKEYKYTEAEKRVKITDIFTVPLKARKFMLMVVVLVSWNIICNVNANTWTYYMMNTVGVSYMMLYICSLTCTVCAVFLQKSWRAAIERFSWFRILLLTVFVTGICELFIGFTTSMTVWVFVAVSIIQGFTAVGTNLVFANLFYINLPDANTDIFATFWNFVANIAAFVGSSLGTLFISIMTQREAANGGPLSLLGLPFYGSQFLVWIKFILLMLLSLYIWKFTPKMKPDRITET